MEVEEADVGETDEERGTYLLMKVLGRLGGRVLEGVEEHAEQVEGRSLYRTQTTKGLTRGTNEVHSSRWDGRAWRVERGPAALDLCVGVEGDGWPVRTREQPRNDTRRGSHVLLDSPEVVRSQRTQASTVMIAASY